MRFYIFLIIFICSTEAYGQKYERGMICGEDTINVDYIDRRAIDRIQYKAFNCIKPSKLGIRFDIGFNHFEYNSKTSKWLGNHHGALFGISIAYRDFSIGRRVKLATVNPQQNLDFNGVTLPDTANLNPIKIDYDLGYSINFKYNFSLEPYLALTFNKFLVVNEDDLGRTYDINRISGLTLGTCLNKYFRIKDFQFCSIFVRYGYGFTNFRLINSNLGRGYSDISFGVAYKGFIKLTPWKKI